MAKTKEKCVWKETCGDFRSVPGECIGSKKDRDKPNTKLVDSEVGRGRCEGYNVADSQSLRSVKKVGLASVYLTNSPGKRRISYHRDRLIKHPRSE